LGINVQHKHLTLLSRAGKRVILLIFSPKNTCAAIQMPLLSSALPPASQAAGKAPNGSLKT
jgi:hypothetical protein